MQMTYRQAVLFTASLNRAFLESVPSDSVNRNDDSVNKLFTDIQLQWQSPARDKRGSAWEGVIYMY